jgi:cytochrome b561
MTEEVMTMNLKGNSEEYGIVAQGLHWVTAILVVLMIPLGFYMARVSYDPLFYRVHIFLGFAVLVLTLFRILWIFIDERPDRPSDMSQANFYVYKGVYVLLYVALVAMTLTGLGMFILSDLPSFFFGAEEFTTDLSTLPPRPGHFAFALLLTILLLLHLGGVLLHQFTKSDVLGRMGLKRRGS